jgi:hypothetical protein
LSSPCERSRDTQENVGEQIGVVYKLTCQKCQSQNKVATYIGETSRKLSIRIKEHLQLIKDDADFKKKEGRITMVQEHAFKEHGRLCENDIKIEILNVEQRTQARKILEAIQIQEHKPTMNNNNGLDLIW